jgi:hypothetical protein
MVIARRLVQLLRVETGDRGAHAVECTNGVTSLLVTWKWSGRGKDVR